MKEKLLVIITGVIVGIISLALVFWGNPANMGLCIACFIRDISGGLGFHRAEVVQYVRPEIIGLVLGSLIISLFSKEYAPRGGSSPVTRFVISACVMIGALVFLGCPLRMMIRIGGGDLNAIVGLIGFVIGIAIGILCLKKGFNLKRTYNLGFAEGLVFPAVNIVLLVVLIAFPFLLFFSAAGPGSMHAPIFISLSAGLIVGALAQRSRFCCVAGIRDTIMFKDTHMLVGFIAVIVVIIIGNLILGSFNLGFESQPVAHSDGLWNCLSMTVVGFGSVLLGGCPLRQLILSGEGNADSVITVFGLVVGAAISHNFKLASSPDGSSQYGQIAVIICLIILAIIAFTNIQRTKKA